MSSRSYVARHAVVREPSQTLRNAAVLATSVGAAAVATTALAGPALASTAHHRTVWDRVAHCESSDRWHISSGNGYYGGLQFSSHTWHAYGGASYAHHANHASRGEQIQVARRVLHSQGRNAWPVCGPRAGLTKGSGHATGASLPHTAGDGMPASGGTEESHHHKSHHHKSHHHAHKSHHATSHHHKHKSRSHHRHTYVVHRGDTLSGIAQREHVHGGWHALYRANRKHLKSPDVLRVGQHLLIP